MKLSQKLISYNFYALENTELGKRCYIMTLGCLGAYRRLGVGSKLLEHVLTMAKKENVNHVTLHVQVRIAYHMHII